MSLAGSARSASTKSAAIAWFAANFGALRAAHALGPWRSKRQREAREVL
jgi:hypothetical protein